MSNLLSLKVRWLWVCTWACLCLALPWSSSWAKSPGITTTAVASTTDLTPTRLALAALDTSERYVHVRERGGQNRGPEVDVFNRTAGASLASNWCMSYVYTMWDKASTALKTQNVLARTAAVWRQVVHARRFGSRMKVIMAGHRFGTSTLPVLPGDIGIMSTRGTDQGLLGSQWTGHVYLVRDDRGSTVGTREGNTNTDGSRNGYRVAERIRRKDRTLCFLRHEEERA